MKTSTKQIIQFIAACVLLLSGIAMVFISLFIPPQGVIDASVLTALGEMFSMVGGIWGLESYTHIKIHDIDSRLNDKIRREQDESKNEE